MPPRNRGDIMGDDVVGYDAEQKKLTRAGESRRFALVGPVGPATFTQSVSLCVRPVRQLTLKILDYKFILTNRIVLDIPLMLVIPVREHI